MSLLKGLSESSRVCWVNVVADTDDFYPEALLREYWLIFLETGTAYKVKLRVRKLWLIVRHFIKIIFVK